MTEGREQPAMFEPATPVMRSDDYQASKAFYVDVLGFDCVGEAGDPVVGFGMFRRDSARVFVLAWDGAEAPYDRWRAYFHVRDVDELAASIIAAGWTLLLEPYVTEYGMREIEVRDPGGNVLAFGADPEKTFPPPA